MMVVGRPLRLLGTRSLQLLDRYLSHDDGLLHGDCAEQSSAEGHRPEHLSDFRVFCCISRWGRFAGDSAPILTEDPNTDYSHPLPSVLMLTAIVVGVATTATALALIVRIREAYGTIEEDEILAEDDRS